MVYGLLYCYLNLIQKYHSIADFQLSYGWNWEIDCFPCRGHEHGVYGKVIRVFIHCILISCHSVVVGVRLISCHSFAWGFSIFAYYVSIFMVVLSLKSCQGDKQKRSCSPKRYRLRLTHCWKVGVSPSNFWPFYCMEFITFVTYGSIFMTVVLLNFCQRNKRKRSCWLKH